jgi:class 3 adenylate cyclase
MRFDQKKVHRDEALAVARLDGMGPSVPRTGAGAVVARGYRDATLICVDVVNLAAVASSLSPDRLVEMLDLLYRAIDAAALRHGLTRVCGAGEGYAAVAGIPRPRADHARAAAEMALEVASAAVRCLGPDGQTLSLRIGIHTGPVVAALDTSRGTVRELWGDSTRVARLMETQSLPGCIHVSGATAGLLGAYRLACRSAAPNRSAAPGTWFLTGRRAA